MSGIFENRSNARAAHIRTTTRAPGVHVVDTRLVGIIAGVAGRLAKQRERAAVRARVAHELRGYLHHD